MKFKMLPTKSGDSGMVFQCYRPNFGQGNKQPSASLMSAMGEFVNAVNEMDSTVMIPSKLKDLHFNSSTEVDDVSSSSSRSSSWSSTPLSSPELTPPSTPSSSSSTTCPPLSSSLLPVSSMVNLENADLYDCFAMLHAIRTELTAGSHSESSSNADSDVAEHTAAIFRYHLRGLHEVLRQLTSTANSLTDSYKVDIGDCTGLGTRQMGSNVLSSQ